MRSLIPRRRHLTAFLVVLLLACSKENRIEADSEETVLVQDELGPLGGQVVHPRGASLTIPPSALVGLEQITIRNMLDTDVTELPASYERKSDVFSFEPHGQTFTRPVDIGITTAGAVDPGLFTSTDGTRWELVPGATLEGSVMHVYVEHFSYFAVGSGARPELCNVVGDEDRDGRLDCEDSDCASAPECLANTPEDCTASGDEDGDGRENCADSECATHPTCAQCGDGAKAENEACDDGNTVGGDGCARDCQSIEAGYACPTAGVLCQLSSTGVGGTSTGGGVPATGGVTLAGTGGGGTGGATVSTGGDSAGGDSAGGTSAGGTSAGGTFSRVASTMASNGYVNTGTWRGYAFTAETGGATVAPKCVSDGTEPCFTSAGAFLCANGTVAADYSSVALLGWNVNQTDVTPNPPGVWAVTGYGLAVEIRSAGTFPLRVQLQAPAGTTPQRWCAPVPPGGSGTIPWTAFNTACWDGSGTKLPAATTLEQVQITVPGDLKPIDFEFCVVSVEPV